MIVFFVTVTDTCIQYNINLLTQFYWHCQMIMCVLYDNEHLFPHHSTTSYGTVLSTCYFSKTTLRGRTVVPGDQWTLLHHLAAIPDVSMSICYALFIFLILVSNSWTERCYCKVSLLYLWTLLRPTLDGGDQFRSGCSRLVKQSSAWNESMDRHLNGYKLVVLIHVHQHNIINLDS